jgi:xanthine dehydrogenase YagS FAD-binding subunit
MHPFDFHRASDSAGAVTSGARDGARFIAGGTNLVDLMKAGVETPAHIVDVNALPLVTVDAVNGGLRIGALARMSDVAANALVKQHAPVISQALLLSASPQLRNMASIGGNLMQRTRCPYFRELLFAPCNKRNPGSGCAAMEGDNRMHAVLGISDDCIATHPSDLAVALSAMDAVITVRGPHGERKINAADFHLLPRHTPHLEHDLQHGELITSVFVPDAPHTRHSAYLKVRDRASFEFALASAAVGVELVDGRIRNVRVALGGIATKPWRARAAEASLVGKRPSPDVFRAAAEAELTEAKSHGGNDYKIELAKRTLVRALGDLTGGAA